MVWRNISSYIAWFLRFKLSAAHEAMRGGIIMAAREVAVGHAVGRWIQLWRPMLMRTDRRNDARRVVEQRNAILEDIISEDAEKETCEEGGKQDDELLEFRRRWVIHARPVFTSRCRRRGLYEMLFPDNMGKDVPVEV